MRSSLSKFVTQPANSPQLTDSDNNQPTPNHHPPHAHYYTTAQYNHYNSPQEDVINHSSSRRSSVASAIQQHVTNKSDEMLLTEQGVQTLSPRNDRGVAIGDDEGRVLVERNANWEQSGGDVELGMISVCQCTVKDHHTNVQRSKHQHHHPSLPHSHKPHHHLSYHHQHLQPTKYNSVQNIALVNHQPFCASLTKLDGQWSSSSLINTTANSNQQYSLERRPAKRPALKKQHSYTCESHQHQQMTQQQRIMARVERDLRMQQAQHLSRSPPPPLPPEVLAGNMLVSDGGFVTMQAGDVDVTFSDVLRSPYGGSVGSGGGKDSVIGSGGRGPQIGGDDYGFSKRLQQQEQQQMCQSQGRGSKRSSLRSNGGSGGKRRPAGDGMAAITPLQDDNTDLIFELPDQMNESGVTLSVDGNTTVVDCDRIIYGPGFTYIHDDLTRFPPAPDVTRRLGANTPLGGSSIMIAAGKPGNKDEATPPYYRASSATSSSSQSSRVDLSTRHWYLIMIVLLVAAAAGVGVPLALKISAGASLDERLEFASRLLQEVPLIDGHNDLPWNIRKFLHNRLREFRFDEDLRKVPPWSTSAWSHTDLVRLKRGHVAAQFWAAYVPCDSQYRDAVQLTLEQIDVIRRLTDLYQPSLTLCTSAEDIRTAYKKNQMCSLIGVEGGHSLAGSLAVLRTLYHVGVRYLTLTSTCNTPWADCSHADLPGKKPEHGGLTTFGKSVVKEMNRLGMIVDLSHVSVRTMRDALSVSKAPVIFSHSSAHALCNSTRNVPDATLRKLALNRGIVMVNFYSLFLTCNAVSTVADAVAHINHIRDIAGVDNVGLGAGYDGINSVPTGLEDVSAYPTLFAELIGTGKWTVDDLKKLAGLNFLRVFQEVEKVRNDFQKANVPPYEDVLMPKPKENNCSSQENG